MPDIVGKVIGVSQATSVLVSTPHCLRVTIVGRGGIPPVAAAESCAAEESASVDGLRPVPPSISATCTSWGAGPGEEIIRTAMPSA